MPRILILFLVIAWNTGCTRGEEEPAGARKDSPWQLLGYIDRDVCPFECCTYGRVTALTDLKVYDSDWSQRPSFTLPAGAQVVAVTGNVHLTEVGLVAVLETYRTADADGDPVDLHPGDTVLVLSHRGEEAYNVRVRGELFETVPRFWSGAEPREEGARAILIRPPASEWWVRIRDDRDRSGWIRMDEARVAGLDACA